VIPAPPGLDAAVVAAAEDNDETVVERVVSVEDQLLDAAGVVVVSVQPLPLVAAAAMLERLAAVAGPGERPASAALPARVVIDLLRDRDAFSDGRPRPVRLRVFGAAAALDELGAAELDARTKRH
jgi:hypothetical protein